MAVRSEGRPATIADVATAAAVSQATVSRVVNGKISVDPSIARRVLDVVAELGYRPSTSARNLARGSTQTVAVLVPDLGNPMFQEVLRGVTHAAAAAGYRVLVADSEESPADEAELAREARRRCDALVLVAPRMPHDELRDLLASLAPVVLVNRSIEGTPDVAVDYATAAFDAVGHLVALGHTRLVYLAGPASSESNRRRLAGITAVMSLLEGHADVVMDDVGPQVVPTVATIRARFSKRRAGRGAVDQVLRRLLGLDAKARQYADGARFVRGVIDQVGMDGFNAVWTSPQTLPLPEEIADPPAWVRRVHG